MFYLWSHSNFITATKLAHALGSEQIKEVTCLFFPVSGVETKLQKLPRIMLGLFDNWAYFTPFLAWKEWTIKQQQQQQQQRGKQEED